MNVFRKIQKIKSLKKIQFKMKLFQKNQKNDNEKAKDGMQGPPKLKY